MVLYYIAFLVIIFMIAFLVTKAIKEEGEKQFDERQKFEQMKGYKYGFFSMIGFLTLYALLGSVENLTWITAEAVGVTGIACGALTFSGYSIWKDVYSTRTKRESKNMGWLFAVVGIMNLWLATTRMIEGEMIVDGKLSGSYLNLVIGVLFVVLFLLISIRDLKDRKKD